MAQQTINIGASPNDGTGTPLRTAFQYTNSNFSELYTAVGPSGNNIVVPGSATITGDLTVDTSTLKVDSANNRVGIGTTGPVSSLTVGGSGMPTLKITETASALYDRGMLSFGDGGGTNNYVGVWRAAANSVSSGGNWLNLGGYDGLLIATGVNTLGSTTERCRVDFGGTWTWSNVGGVAGTAMTLNSTGLGVGVSPTRKLSVSGAGGGFDVTDTTQSTRIRMRSSSASNFYIEALNSAESAYVTLRLNDTTQIDSAGNWGIGVTPSAWAAGYKAIQIAASQSTALMGSGNQTELTTNAFFDGAWKYQGAGTVAASRYSQQSGVHYWYSAAAGAAGTAIGSGFTNAAMTLDASGRLILLASTTTPATLSTNGQLTFTATSDTNLRFSYRGSDGVTRVANLTLA